ncbi:WD domain, G-beta repeat family protein [Candida albicans]|uniref:Elongator complex protein 2 n=1 Tax=Candida albicans TaxID=5476 RepID=A0A8H6F1H9_CANAX|nr:WD domain, G-beta repeat family protein [Candida albicans]
MTKSISKLLQNLCGTQIVEENEQLPITASLPVLGLSNKAENQIEQGDQQDVDNEDNTPEAAEDVLASLDSPPVEEYLQRYTLFPELEKLYGHGYEISCCATSPDGKLIASACRSNNAKHAVIRFQTSRIESKAHARILWDCSWFPVGDSFTTVSRDKQIKLWKVSNDKVEMVVSTKLNDAITSVSVYKGGLFNNQAIVAVGLEDGGISIFAVDVANPEFRLISIVDKELTPSIELKN